MDIGADYDGLIQEALSGDGDGQLGEEQLGYEIAALCGDAIGAKAAARAVRARSGVNLAAMSTEQLRKLARQIAPHIPSSKNQEFGRLLVPDINSKENVFGLRGSINLLTIRGTAVLAGGATATYDGQIPRKGVVRRMIAQGRSRHLLITSAVVGGIPFNALSYPYALEQYAADSLTMGETRPITIEANSAFSFTIYNPMGSDIIPHVEFWGTSE